MNIITPAFEDIINSFIENLRNQIPEATTTPRSVIREALINPATSQITSLFDLAKRISTLQNVFEAEGTDLDNIAKSYGLSRKEGQKASGIIYVDLAALNSRAEVTLPSGTLVSTKRGAVNGTTYSVVGDYTFSFLNRALYESAAAQIRDQLDSVGMTQVTMVASVSIVANSTGTTGNIGPYVLNALSTSGISQCINISTISGGTNAESDNSLRNRVVLLFSGNSVGTENGLLNAALSTTGVQSGFLVPPGDPLMTRDGTVRDDEGNIITVGSGRAVDIYVQGTQLSSQSENVIFKENNTSNFLSSENAVEIAQPTIEGEFGTAPVHSVTSVIGQTSGASFSEGIPISDEEGNILIEGNFALVKDVEATKYSIVENLITRERKLALYVNPLTTKYTIIEQLVGSDSANSALSKDKLIFLKNKVEVTEEEITRGQYNGADSLRFENVTDVNEVFERLEIVDTIKISSFEEVPGGVVLEASHKPIDEIIRVTNTRLGVDYSSEIYDAENGLIKISGRVLPKASDILRLEYVWKKKYAEKLNFNLTGDLIDWIYFADEQNVTDNDLLASTNLQQTNLLDRQPNIATNLNISMSGLSDREVVETTIVGTTVNFNNDELVLKGSEKFLFANTSQQNIGKIFSVKNTTQGFEYNLAGYELQNNKFDKSASVDSTLLGQQFRLNTKANEEAIDVGDRVVLGRPSRILSLSTEKDFENSIENNLAPIFDPTKLDFSSGGIFLKTPLLDTSTTPTILSGTITQDLTLSGLVEVIEDVIINEGVVVDIEPNTTIKIRPSDQLNQQIYSTDNVRFDPTLVQSQTLGVPSLPYEEYFYIYLQLENYASTSFTIINSEGKSIRIRFGVDILRKTINGTQIEFYLNDLRIPSSFNPEIEQTLDLNDISGSIKATFLGARTGVSGVPVFFSAYVESQDKYVVLLEKNPIVTSNLLNDFSIVVAEDQTISFERFSYNSTLNAIECSGDILTIDGYGEIGQFEILDVQQVVVESESFLELELNTIANVQINYTIKQEKRDISGRILDVVWSKIKAINSVDNKVLLEYFDDFEVTTSLNTTTIIDSSTSDATDYLISYFTEEKRRIAITVDGTLRTLGTSSQQSVLFTSASSNATTLDWEGIVFTPKSHTNNSQTQFQSNLKNCRIRFANSGVVINASDVNVQSCIIRDCQSTGILMTSTTKENANFVDDNYQLLQSPQSSSYHNYPYGAFLKNASRPGYVAADGLAAARFSIPENMVTNNNTLPPLRQKLDDKNYVVDLVYGVDYVVYLDGQDITAIDTDADLNTIEYSLAANSDFLIEYNIETGYSLVFFYTANSSRLRKVYDMIASFETLQRVGSLSLDFYSSVRGGLIYDNLIFNTGTGIVLGNLSTVSINRNTIDNVRIGLDIAEAICSVRNNIITNYQVAGIVSDSKAFLEARRNNIYSQKVVDENSLAISDNDLLLRSVEQTQITFYVRTPQKFKIGSIVKLDGEEVLVQGVNADSIIVKRGYNNTPYQKHASGTILNIYQFNQIFTVTGILGESCKLIETDSLGRAIESSIPIQMRQVGKQTFRVAFPTNRRNDFYYKYQYVIGSETKETQTKVFLRSRPGIGVNDIYSLYHELPLNGYTANMENLSIDPIYTNSPAADYSLSKLSSYCSKDNPIYQAISSPNVNHHYVGYLEVRNDKTLNEGLTRVPVYAEPLVIDSLENECEIIPVGNANYIYASRRPIEFTTSITEDEANAGAIGVLVLADPISLNEAGEFQIRYRRAVDLGTTIPPYYLEGEISYTFDIGKEVVFEKLKIRKDDIGGIIETTFSVASSLENLNLSVISDISQQTEFLLEEYGENIGNVIQLNLKLRGNDSYYDNNLNYVFPLLQDFSLTYTPARDQQEYQVISLINDKTQNRTNLLLGAPISNTTFNTVGQDTTIEIYLRKQSDNFDPNKQFLVALADQVSSGQTYIAAYGDLTFKRFSPSSADVIRIDYLSTGESSETLYFIEDGNLITSNLYSEIESITSVVYKDRKIVTPSQEEISIVGMNQPVEQNDYFVTYQFEAPLDGETLAIDYVYNSLIRSASQEVEVRKSIFTDVQVRQVQSIPVTIAVALVVESDVQSPLSVKTEVGNAIVQLFNDFVDITVERRLDPSDIIRATGGIAGIEEIEVTTLSENGLMGEVETLIFEKREYPVLADQSPQINTSQNNKVVG